MSTATDAGKKFLTELLAHVPDDKRADVQATLEANEKALETIGASTLRHSEFARQMDELRATQEATAAWKAQLDEWYATNQAKLTANPDPAPIVDPAKPAPLPTVGDYLTKADFAKELASQQAQAVSAIVHTTQLASKHMKTFGEVLDIQALMGDREIGTLGLLGVYDKTYKPRYDELAKKADDDRVNKLVSERLAEERKAFQSHPYPLTGNEPSILDGIEAALRNPPDPTKPITPPVGSLNVVDQAVQQYHEAQLKHGVFAP